MNNTNGDYWGRTPFNLTSVVGGQDFLDCLNHTVAAAIPIVNPSLTYQPFSGPSTGQKVGIGLGVTAAVLLLVLVAWVIWRRGKRNRVDEEDEKSTSRR